MVYRKVKTLFVFPILEMGNQVSTFVTLEKKFSFLYFYIWHCRYTQKQSMVEVITDIQT